MEWLELLMRRRALVAIALVAALVVTAVVLRGDTREAGPEPVQERRLVAPALADPVPYDGRSPRAASGDEVRVLVRLPRPALGELRDLDARDDAARRAYVANLRAESRALRSGLTARRVRLRDVVTFERAWHGFAATVRARDLDELSEAGLRTRHVRRFYPALSEPVPVAPPAAARDDGPAVALLAGGVGGAKGHDLVDGDADPAPGRDPRDPRRREKSGEALASVLRGSGAAVIALRVSALRATPGSPVVEEYARTDELLAGIERTVEQGIAVALVGVNAPYAGFADAPEIEAVRGAGRLGTLVVAPSGHEGPGRGAYGTIGSPGAAPRAITTAPLSDPAAIPRLRVQAGEDAELDIAGAAALGGGPPARGIIGKGQGHVHVVRADANPGAAISAAAAAGAVAVIVAEPRPRRALASVPAGRVGIAVIGVSGEAARALLEVDEGQPVRFGAPSAPADTVAGRVSPFASTGPSYDRTDPETEAPASVLTPVGFVSGSAVAAAVVAAAAAKLSGTPQARTAAMRRRFAHAGVRRVPAPPGAPRVGVGPLVLQTRGGRTTGVSMRVGAFDRGDAAAGIGTLIVPADRLELQLETAGGRSIRRLTPAGGERGLLPGEYAYQLSRTVLADLPTGAYRFRAQARAPRQRRATVAFSDTFRAP